MSSCITSSVDPAEGCWDWKYQKVDSAIKRCSTSNITVNVDDDTCSDDSCGDMDPTNWTDEEKSIFIQAVSSYGKDFAKISRCVRTRSRDQCKVFFRKARKCLGLDSIQYVSRNGGTPLSDDGNGGGSDMEDAYIMETSSVIHNKKLGTKMDEDLPSCVLNINQDGSDTVEIQTGRPHQIRIHLAFMGHPLLGDPLYVVGGQPKFIDPELIDESFAKDGGYQRPMQPVPGDCGYYLHAHQLALPHPTKNEMIKITAPLPAVLQTCEEAKERHRCIPLTAG